MGQQNHRIMGWFGLQRDLGAPLDPPLPWTGTLSTAQVAQSSSQPGLEHFCSQNFWIFLQTELRVCFPVLNPEWLSAASNISPSQTSHLVAVPHLV